ncbi:MAG TPA: hypothetical protein VFE05_00770 [Longimicrobiaceae bacterium]|jgi:hypothetical protein|nr:hypothetical protein [Longimicrobiaceae bacterium]
MLRVAVRTVLAGLVVLAASPALAQTRASAAPTVTAVPVGPAMVTVGAYIVDLTDFDIKSGTYVADYYIWLRWSGKADPSKFEIMNGNKLSCNLGLETRKGDAHYQVYRCQHRFHADLDLEKYPLDSHNLTIEVEDQALMTDSLRYVPDQEETAREHDISIPGWVVGEAHIDTVTHVYRTNLGFLERPPHARSPYSRIIVTVPIHHEEANVYLKSFLVLFISVAIGLLASLLSPAHVEARLGVGVAAIFGVVSSYLVVAQSLPPTAQFTLADKLHVASMAVVSLSILTSAVVYRASERVGEERANRWDQWIGAATAVGFILWVTLLTIYR